MEYCRGESAEEPERRPSAAGNGYDAANSAAATSARCPRNSSMREGRVAQYRKETGSTEPPRAGGRGARLASGLDPHIT